MIYFKKSELAETYHISNKTVYNWIKEAQAGKLDLEIDTSGITPRIPKTTRNIALIEKLAEERKKYRNTRGAKTITPKPEFYKLYNSAQIFDITHNLDTYHEIPYQYGYFNGGAEYWDAYINRLGTENVPNFLNATIKLLSINQAYLDSLLERYKRINVIDVGPGNALPVKGLLEHLLARKKLGRYIAVDISSAMLKVAEQNITQWFGSKVAFEGYELDINYDRFINAVASEQVGDGATETVNLVLALGGTFENLRSSDGALKVIHDSLGRNDLLVYSLKLDSEQTRQYFDFSVGSKIEPLDAQTRMLIDLFNIDESLYDVEMGYDDHLRERYIRIRFKVVITLTFDLENGKRSIEFNKNDTILLWRYWHQSAQEVTQQLDHVGMEVLQISQTEDADYLFTVSRVRCSR